MLLESERTREHRRVAPRTVMVALTNACNKTCAFCYRPTDAASRFTFDGVLELARFLDDWGVLELTFGGGEPTIFPRFGELLRAIWAQTRLCPSFTTNGLRLRETGLLRTIRGAYGQLQLSVYDEDDTLGLIDHLVAEEARFGLNYLVTPTRVRTLEVDLASFASRGVRDVLLLSYKGDDPSLHLDADDCRRLDESLVRLSRSFEDALTLKLDVCWGARLPNAPKLFDVNDCEAGDDFLSITSDRRVQHCSFAQHSVPFGDVAELRGIWEQLRGRRETANVRGCTR
ncbi:MAG: radical SAM protein [Myxococcota bacterium]